MKVIEVLFFFTVFGFLFWAIYKAITEKEQVGLPNNSGDSSPDLMSLSTDDLIEQLKIKIALEETKAKAGVLSSESLLESYKEQLIKAEQQRDKYKHL